MNLIRVRITKRIAVAVTYYRYNQKVPSLVLLVYPTITGYTKTEHQLTTKEYI
jgi:hypothetical protein